MNARDENLEAWRSVAGGWERRRELIWTTTRPVAERLVDLLEPRPGQVVLELAGIGVDQFNIYLMTHGQEETLQTYGDDIIPQFESVTA